MDIIASIVLFGCLLGAEFSFVFGNTVSCACTDEYDPVCGEDGLDYPNSCSAVCSGVKVGHSGKCNHNAATNNATTTTQKQSICPAIYDPVCGKDKKTYSSKCVAISRGVAIAYPGQCETEYQTTTTTKPTPCICPDVYDPVCGKDGKTYSNKCKAKCSGIEVEHMGECKSKDKCICPAIYAPVCGKDGKTYSNECRAKCSGTEVAYTGECRTKQNATTNTTAHCVCPAIYDPVCAKDGKTYSSKCNAECRGLTVKYTGECILEEKCICPMTYAPVCGKDGKTYSNQCDAKCSGVEVYSDGKCEDDDTDKPSCICTLDYRPVCGSDGQTYSNECHARCSGTEVAYTGQCETEYETTTTTKPTPCICSYIYDPVCGKDGKTYSSKCNAKCSGVTIAYPGQCETEYQTTTTTKPTPCVCPAVYDPVCGKDGKTYSNKCKAKCSGIEVAHKGECESKENCACSKKYAPVCGKDGKTYSNECIAKCSGVEIYSSGKCEKNVIDKPTYHVTLKATKLTTTEATTTKATTTTKPTTKPTPCFCPAVYDPVCGKDGKTYSNKCNAKCSGIEIDHQGRCEEKVADKPSCVCTSNYDPVCGSDGRTYGNECEAKCSQVDVINRSPCRAKQDDATVVERCKCRPTFKPVCGTDEVTYGNECHARCRGVAVVYSGGCRRKTMYRGYDNNNYWNPYCICPDYFRPVCGQNGVTYASSCVASCSNVNVKSHEPCEVDPMKRERPGPTDCSCNRSFKPVCGNDGITYANSDCARRCGGVKDYVSGKCEECACNKDYNPVYNFFTGTKYANGCIARCLKVNPNHLRRSYEL